MRRLALTVLPLFALAAAVLAADPKKPDPTFLDPKEAGPDFAVQGEYVGKVGAKDSKPFAAQVVAEGDGKFTVQFLSGGLPGAGWDWKTKVKASAKTDDGKTTFSGGGWSGAIADGQLTGKDDKGRDVYMERTVRHSPTEGKKPPEGAVVLFDGAKADEWEGGKLVEKDLLRMGTTSKRKFKDCTLHVEFRLPFMPKSRGQGRANSGVYLQNRWEVQVLDSFGLEGKNNECGAVYSQLGPNENLCYPPLSWQTYDIDFKAAKFDGDGKQTERAIITVVHNGVKVIDRFVLDRGSTAGDRSPDPSQPGPINLQDHGNPVYYRNIWVAEK